MPFNHQDSAMMACFASADCLIVRLPFAQAIKKGELVNILRLSFSRVGF
jgi:molybdopterin molybdotransferase